MWICIVKRCLSANVVSRIINAVLRQVFLCKCSYASFMPLPPSSRVMRWRLYKSPIALLKAFLLT